VAKVVEAVNRPTLVLSHNKTLAAQLYQEFRLEEFGTITFPCGISPREMGFHSTKRVQMLEDLEGWKVRTSGIWAEISKGMGVSAVVLPGSEIYAALERGVHVLSEVPAAASIDECPRLARACRPSRGSS